MFERFCSRDACAPERARPRAQKRTLTYPASELEYAHHSGDWTKVRAPAGRAGLCYNRLSIILQM